MGVQARAAVGRGVVRIRAGGAVRPEPLVVARAGAAWLGPDNDVRSTSAVRRHIAERFARREIRVALQTRAAIIGCIVNGRANRAVVSLVTASTSACAPITFVTADRSSLARAVASDGALLVAVGINLSVTGATITASNSIVLGRTLVARGATPTSRRVTRASAVSKEAGGADAPSVAIECGRALTNASGAVVPIVSGAVQTRKIFILNRAILTLVAKEIVSAGARTANLRVTCC